MSSLPTVSVVVPTYNRRDRLEHVLDALFAQHTDVPFEIVVVSDGSTDGTDAYLSTAAAPAGSRATLRHVRQENSGPAAARNRGVDLARGEIVVFVDDDNVTRERTQVLDEGRFYIERSEEQCVDLISDAFAGVRPVRNRLTTSVYTDDLLCLHVVPQVISEHR